MTGPSSPDRLRELKRYDPVPTLNGTSVMDPDPDGHWLWYDDVQAALDSSTGDRPEPTCDMDTSDSVCGYCTGEACAKCPTPSLGSPCSHDVIDRHPTPAALRATPQPAQGDRPEPLVVGVLARAMHDYMHLDSEDECDAVGDARAIAAEYDRLRATPQPEPTEPGG